MYMFSVRYELNLYIYIYIYIMQIDFVTQTLNNTFKGCKHFDTDKVLAI